jgi:hypothetical protein
MAQGGKTAAAGDGLKKTLDAGGRRVEIWQKDGLQTAVAEPVPPQSQPGRNSSWQERGLWNSSWKQGDEVSWSEPGGYQQWAAKDVAAPAWWSSSPTTAPHPIVGAHCGTTQPTAVADAVADGQPARGNQPADSTAVADAVADGQPARGSQPADSTAVADVIAEGARDLITMIAASNPMGAEESNWIDAFAAIPITRGYKQHNIALKWFRDISERAGLSSHTFSNRVPAHVPNCVHEPKSPLYHFEGMETGGPWFWKEMVAQLNEDSLRKVFEGLVTDVPQSRNSRGIVGCKIEKTNKYDHKRHHANVPQSRAAPMLMVWDFVLMRSDGTKIYLHPNYGDTKIPCYELAFDAEHEQDHEVPRSGKGGTSGPGTFRRLASRPYTSTLRFDVSRTPQSPTPQSHCDLVGLD